MHPDPSSKVYTSQVLSPFHDEDDRPADDSAGARERNYSHAGSSLPSRASSLVASGGGGSMAASSASASLAPARGIAGGGVAGTLLAFRRGVAGSAPRSGGGTMAAPLAPPGAGDLPLSQTLSRPPSMRLAPTAPHAAVHGSSGMYSSPARLRAPSNGLSSSDRAAGGRPAGAGAGLESHPSPHVRAVSFDEEDSGGAEHWPHSRPMHAGGAGAGSRRVPPVPSTAGAAGETALSAGDAACQPLLLLPGVDALSAEPLSTMTALQSAGSDVAASAPRVGRKRKASDMANDAAGGGGGGGGGVAASAITVNDTPDSATGAASTGATTSSSHGSGGPASGGKRQGATAVGGGSAAPAGGGVGGIAAFFKTTGGGGGGGGSVTASAAKKPRVG
jgi:hypothetical protein